MWMGRFSAFMLFRKLYRCILCEGIRTVLSFVFHAHVFRKLVVSEVVAVARAKGIPLTFVCIINSTGSSASRVT